LAGTPVASSTEPVPVVVGGNSDSTTDVSCTKSSTDPTVTAVRGFGAATASVKTAGSNVLLPSGKTTRNSAAPCRCILPSTRNTLPRKGCRSRVTVTDAGKSSIPVVSRVFLRQR